MNRQDKILKEETEGIDNFIKEILSVYNMSDELKSFVKKFIEESECKKIEFANFKIPALGVALHDGVLINKDAIKRGGLEFLLFVIFHETAHQYQFKKYGKEVMYDCYLGEISDDKAADFMKKTEEVADEFGIRKIRQLQKNGLIKKEFMPPQIYKNVPISHIKQMVVSYKMQMRKNKVDSPEKISEFFYNMIKRDL